MKRKMIPAITPTDTERLIFDVLLDACKRFELPTTVRVAGGWVRDKLLGVEFLNDIDIAVDQGTGESFGDAVKQYVDEVKLTAAAQQRGEEVKLPPGVKYYASKLNMSSVGKVKKNPEQSKHLATATFRLCGLELEVTNLRTETYAETSRIPEIEVGTAEEDAYRRDLTINSLFYNLHTEEVEDFTGRGVTDLLERKLIKTPLEPVKTFMDDPLRVMRVIRFACRYNYKMDAPTLTACGLPEVRARLQNRMISKERIGVELEKIFRHKSPVSLALQYMLRAQLPEPVFLTDQLFREKRVVGAAATGGAGGAQNEKQSDHPGGRWWRVGYLTNDFLEQTMQTRESAAWSGDLRWFLRLASFLSAFGRRKLKDGKRDADAIAVIMWEGLALKKPGEVAGAFARTAIEVFLPMLQKVVGSGVESLTGENMVTIGEAMRQHKQDWRFALFLAEAISLGQSVDGMMMLQEQESGVRTSGEQQDNSSLDETVRLLVTLPESVAVRRNRESEGLAAAVSVLLQKIRSHGLEGCWEWTPAFTGKALTDDLKVPRGPMMGQVIKQQIAWKLENPHIADEEIRERILRGGSGGEQ